MTRPANLPVALQSWATGVYGAGPSWAGTPQRAAPGASFLTPGLTLPAEVENYLHGSVFDVAQATLNLVGQVEGLNFGAAVTGIGTLKGAVYNKALRTWFILGLSANIRLSNDAGQSFSSASPGGAGTEIYHSMAFDAAGNGVAVGVNAATSPITNAYTASTNTWAGPNVLVASAVNTANGDQTEITFDPVSGLYCAFFRLFASPFTQVYTSANRTAWTNRTAPTNFTTSNSLNKTATNGLGRTVATAHNGAGTISIATSDDGGVTWTARSNLTSTISTTLPAFPSYNPVTATWMITVPKIATHTGEVWTSSDGVTWAKQVTLANAEVFGQAPCGTMWVAMTNAGGVYAVVISLDGGVTWLHTGRAFSGAGISVYAEPLGLALLTTTTFTPGIRAGMPTIALT